MTILYWKIGQHIVEFEQQGNAMAKYGTSMQVNLSKLLRIKLGKGYSRPNLNNMRKFYLLYPSCDYICSKLTWTHICELIKMAGRSNKTSRHLEPNISVASFWYPS